MRTLDHKCISGDFAKIKIKMEPKSLVLDVPLDWQVYKIKCLLVKMIPKLEFNMFVLHHDNQMISGKITVREMILDDQEAECKDKDYYSLTFSKSINDKNQFQQYYNHQMKLFYSSTVTSLYQPILHPKYSSNKYLNKVENLKQMNKQFTKKPFNVNEIEDLLRHQRMPPEQLNQNNANANNANNQANLGGQDEGNGENRNWILYSFIKLIQAVSIITILNMLYHHSDIQIFIVLFFIVIAFFIIEYHKPNNKPKEDENNIENKQNKQKVEVLQKKQKEREKITFLGKLWLIVIVSLVESLCYFLELIVSFSLSLFPNWTVEDHKQWFKNYYERISAHLENWKSLYQKQTQPSNLNKKDEIIAKNTQQIHQNDISVQKQNQVPQNNEYHDFNQHEQ